MPNFTYSKFIMTLLVVPKILDILYDTKMFPFLLKVKPTRYAFSFKHLTYSIRIFLGHCLIFPLFS